MSFRMLNSRSQQLTCWTTKLLLFALARISSSFWLDHYLANSDKSSIPTSIGLPVHCIRYHCLSEYSTCINNTTITNQLGWHCTACERPSTRPRSQSFLKQIAQQPKKFSKILNVYIPVIRKSSRARSIK